MIYSYEDKKIKVKRIFQTYLVVALAGYIQKRPQRFQKPLRSKALTVCQFLIRRSCKLRQAKPSEISIKKKPDKFQSLSG
jgi:hypothetical protein